MSLAPELPEADPGVTTAADPETCDSILRKVASTGSAPLMLRPSSHDFGVIAASSKSDMASFTITNCGRMASGPVMVTIVGVSMGDFTIDSPGCAAPLESGASCTVGVRFVPHATGRKTAETTFGVGSYPGRTVSAAMTGTGE
jgi:hypothetical protein